jgi:hypothetical protein
MATLPQGFSARTVEPQGSAQQLPVSDALGHPVVITESEMKQVEGKANCGYLQLTLRIIDGEHAGTEGAYRLNLYHDNIKTVEIANRQLSSLCHVVNQLDAVDSAQLHNIPFRAVVGLQKKATPDAPDYTEVKAVKDINGNDAGKTGKSAPTQAPAPPQAPAQAPVQQAPVQQQAPTQAPWGGQAPVQQAPTQAPWGGQQQAPVQQAPVQGATPPWAVPK